MLKPSNYLKQLLSFITPTSRGGSCFLGWSEALLKSKNRKLFLSLSRKPLVRMTNCKRVNLTLSRFKLLHLNLDAFNHNEKQLHFLLQRNISHAKFRRYPHHSCFYSGTSKDLPFNPDQPKSLFNAAIVYTRVESVFLPTALNVQSLKYFL